MTEIHPTAIVEDGAEIGAGVRIGPYCVIGPEVRIDEGCVLHSHVVVTSQTTIGAGCQIYPFASLGHPPQDMKYGGEKNRLVIGERNIIREYVTMNPGTKPDERLTQVGSDSMFMIGAHIAHDCVIGDHVVFANNATLGGHCSVGDYAIIGGLAAVHQTCRIGRCAFIGGITGVRADVIPFATAVGENAQLGGLNLIGMKRRGFSRDEIHAMRKAYRMLFEGEGEFSARLDEVAHLFADQAHVQEVVDFIRTASDRKICMPRSTPEG